MNRMTKWIGAGMCTLMLGSVVALAEDAPPPQPTHAHHSGLVKPWSELSSLTDDQKAKITEIHQKATDEMKEIRTKEQNDIMALLSDDQKKELATIEAAAHAHHPHATTMPAGKNE